VVVFNPEKNLLQVKLPTGFLLAQFFWGKNIRLEGASTFHPSESL